MDRCNLFLARPALGAQTQYGGGISLKGNLMDDAAGRKNGKE